jgi:N-methylhydantoinase A
MMLPGLLDLVPLQSVIVPPNPGGFSALGLLSSDRVFSESVTLYGVLTPELAATIDQRFAELETGLLARAGVGAGDARVLRTFDGRLLGQGWETPFVAVPAGPLGPPEIEQMVEAFHREYEQRNGHRFASFPVEGVTYRVQVVVPSSKVSFEELPARTTGAAPPVRGVARLQHLYEPGVDAPCHERAELLADDVLPGPAIVWEPTSTTFVPDGRTAVVGTYGELVVT